MKIIITIDEMIVKDCLQEYCNMTGINYSCLLHDYMFTSSISPSHEYELTLEQAKKLGVLK